jgi:hypothetical protein
MTIAARRIPSVRFAPGNTEVLQELGPLANLVGTWEGRGFNLIARPDFHDRANLYLQLSQTHENLRVSPIGSAIPNRGFGQDDINLYGVDYLDKIHDEHTGGALHLEPGLWVYQPDPATTFPPENVDPAQLVHRMASIPHGNAVLASGTATSFTGPPTLDTEDVPYHGSIFPSFNSTPFGAGGPLNAAGSSDAGTAAANPNVVVKFDQYDLGVPAGSGNPRTPYDTDPPDQVDDPIDGLKLQDVVNDPILLLQAQIQEQVARGDQFEGIALNIASQATVTFNTQPNSVIGPGAPTVKVPVPGADGGTENILFLDGVPDAAHKPVNNAHTALVYATFWITTVHPKDRAPYQQLQYAQMVELDFPIFSKLNPTDGSAPVNVDLGWPHISVATLRKSFNA